MKAPRVQASKRMKAQRVQTSDAGLRLLHQSNDTFDSSGAADIIDGHLSTSSVHSSTSSLAIVGLAAKPQPKPRLLHTPGPSSVYLNIYLHYH